MSVVKAVKRISKALGGSNRLKAANSLRKLRNTSRNRKALRATVGQERMRIQARSK